jgi:hypothetical protein
VTLVQSITKQSLRCNLSKIQWRPFRFELSIQKSADIKCPNSACGGCKPCIVKEMLLILPNETVN